MNKYGRLLILGLALLPLAAMGETYKCRAPDGRISYAGQMSMERGVKCEQMFVRKSPQSKADASSSSDQAPGAAGAPQPGQPSAPADAAKPAGAQQTPEDMELDAKRKKQEADEAKKKADKVLEDKLAEQKLKEDNCRTAQANLQLYQQGGRIAHIDEKGEKIYLSDDEINRNRDAAKQEVARWCGS